MILNKDEILKANQLPFKDVDVSKWLGEGTSIRVRVMTAKEKETFETSCFSTKGKKVEWVQENYRSKLLVATIVGDNNERLFDDKTGVEDLAGLNSLMVTELYNASASLNGLSADDVEAEAKNSEADQT